jgi:hypothetical protein
MSTRHSRKCKLCSHSQREAIESEYVNWTPTAQIAKRYRVRRDTLYAHALAQGLTAARERNVKAALSNYIERCHKVRPSAAAMVSAIVALSKLNAEGQTVDRVAVNSSENFAGWTRGELEDWLLKDVLPSWYTGPLRRLTKADGAGLAERVN